MIQSSMNLPNIESGLKPYFFTFSLSY